MERGRLRPPTSSDLLGWGPQFHYPPVIMCWSSRFLCNSDRKRLLNSYGLENNFEKYIGCVAATHPDILALPDFLPAGAC